MKNELAQEHEPPVVRARREDKIGSGGESHRGDLAAIAGEAPDEGAVLNPADLDRPVGGS